MITTSLRMLRLENRLYMARANERPTGRRQAAADGLLRRWARWMKAGRRSGRPTS